MAKRAAFAFAANRRAALRRRVAGGLVLPLLAALVVGMPGAATAAEPSVTSDRSVPVSPLKPAGTPLPAMPQHAGRSVTWPTPASVVVDVPADARSLPASVVVGGLPVKVSPVVTGDDLSQQGSAGLSAPAPAKVRIEVLDRAAAQRGGAPVAFKLVRADGGTGAAKVHLDVDFNGFRDAFGAAYASRLELRLLPECGLTAVSADQARRGACAGVALDSTNNFNTGVVSADIDLGTPLTGLFAAPMSPKQQALVGIESTEEGMAAPPGDAIVMLTAGNQANGVGTFGKTDLKESGTWAAGGNSGNFSYNYPLTSPPVPGSLTPKLSLDYSSATVDGQTAKEHLQNGPLGEGWSLGGAGFIESTFRACALDQDHSPTWTNQTADPCWRHENYQLSWSGRSGELVPTGVANTWKVASDDASKVEYLAAEGSWRITTGDGTQYYFGKQRLPGWTSGARETGSVLTQEMFANHSGEPCFSAVAYVYSHCTKPYRWLLDYVVDPHGNSMSYWYSRFTNLSGSNNSGQGVFSYHRDAVLDRIEYGTRAGNETTVTAPAMVEFTNSDRCLAADCSPNANWFDTPWDLKCDAAPCNNNVSPSYWTTKRLSKITSKVWSGSGATYKSVDEWSFGHSFPGGTDVPTLWLDSITRKGFDAAGASTTMPALTTHGRRDRNRADYDPNASMADPQKYRIDYIDTEAGGRIEVSYLLTNQPGDACTWWSGKTEAQWPNYNHNASRCFQQWVTNRSGSSAWSWWHKFVVDKVTEKDLVGGSPDKVTSYQYTMDGATSNHPLVLWGYTTSVWPSPKKAMSAWKGYPTVITTIGASGTQSKTKQVFYRGLDRDTGLDPAQEFWRQASVVDSTGGSVTDHAALAGQVREEVVYDGAAGPEVSKTIHTPTAWQTAGGSLPSWQTPPERIAYMNRETAKKTLSKLADGTWRTTESLAAFDTTYGTLTQLDDLGQTLPILNSDNLCTRYTYARNTQDLTLRLGTGSGLVQATGSSIGTDWSAYDFVFSPGDFNGDGKADVLARNSLTTNLVMFTGNGAGGFSSGPVEVGWGWTDMDFIFSPGDFSGDGKPDVLFRRPSTTNLYMLKGNGAGSWTGAITEIGWGWTDMDRIFSPGDFTGDGKNDVLFRRPSTGNLYYLAGNGASSWTGAITQIGTGSWAAKDSFFGKGDVTGDGKTDLYMRETATGNLHLYPGTNSGTLSAPTLVGSGWNVYEHLLTAGDITADGKADLLARYGGVRLTGTAARTETVGVTCAVTPTYPGDLISDNRTFFDGNSIHGSIPMKGMVTKTEQAKSHNGTNPSYVIVDETGYDTYGRPLWSKDPQGSQTDRLYTHNTAGLMSSAKLTAPAATTGAARHEVTTTFDVLRGLPLTLVDPNGKTTIGTYDPLGRMTSVRKPGNTGTYPDTEYAYSVTKTGASHIATKQLGPNGNQIISYEILDGQLRLRQSQATAPDGKRVISDRQYDGRGVLSKASVFYNSASAPTSTLLTFADADVERQTRYTYDGAGRETSSQPWFQGNPRGSQYNTVYTHAGADQFSVTPPLGGIPTTAIIDARGNTRELRQHQGGTIAGAYIATAYTYDRLGQLKTATDSASNAWTYTYDLLGQLTSRTDPDAGQTDMTYNVLGLMETTKNSLNETLFFAYDKLGRINEIRDNSATGTLRSSWLYDTIAKGTLTSATRWVAANGYTSQVVEYDDAYQPKWMKITIPASETGLAGTYESKMTYKANGQIATSWSAALGSLPAETTTYDYNAAGLPTTVTGLDTYLASITYNWDGSIAQSIQGSGTKRVRTTSSYEAATGRMLSQGVDTEISAAPNTWSSRATTDYTYDPTGQVKSVGTTADGVADQKECFDYDYLQRLTKAWTIASGACGTPTRAGVDPYQREWDFDNLGNRTQQIDRDPAGDTTWIYQTPTTAGSQQHTLTQVTATGPKAGTPTRSFTNDAAGNTKIRTTPTGAQQTLAWDPEGNLTSVTGGGANSTYLYTTSGTRLIARDSTVKTLYLGTAELRYDSADGSKKATRYYAGALRDQDTGLHWTAGNQQGTAQMSIKATDLSVTRRRTMPYGETRGTPPASWPDKKGFVGGTEDPTGLVHLGSREYDPTLGRFISVDPLIQLGSSQQINGYSYARNNPTTFSDPGGQADGGLAGSGDSHQVAAVLRAQRIMELYGAKNIWISPVQGHGPDIICWDCGPEILIWEVKPEGTPVNLHESVLWLTGGGDTYMNRNVAIGGALGTPQTGFNSTLFQKVTVYTTEPGLEWYYDEDERDRDEVTKAKAASQKARDKRDDTHLESGPPTKPDPRRNASERRHLENEAGQTGSGAGLVLVLGNDGVQAAPFYEDEIFVAIVSLGGGFALIRISKAIGDRTTRVTRTSTKRVVNRPYNSGTWSSRNNKNQKMLDKAGV